VSTPVFKLVTHLSEDADGVASKNLGDVFFHIPARQELGGEVWYLSCTPRNKIRNKKGCIELPWQRLHENKSAQ